MMIEERCQIAPGATNTDLTFLMVYSLRVSRRELLKVLDIAL